MRNFIRIAIYCAVVIAAIVLSAFHRPIVSDARRDRLALAIFRQFPLPERLDCAMRGHFWNPDLDTLALTVAITDVESYVRPRWVRLLKSAYFAGYRRMFSERPDWSIGPAQIKISNIEKIIETRDAFLLDRMADECTNISIAYCFVSGLRAGRPLTSENIARIAELYNGQKKSTETDAAVQYIGLVSRIFSMARKEVHDVPKAAGTGSAQQRHVCL